MISLAAALLLLGAAHAQAPAPCTGFDWPLTMELAMMENAPGSSTRSGTVFQIWPEGAERLELIAGGETGFPVPPEKAPAPRTASGYMTIPAPEKPGVYQVSLSAKAWIDVIQNGKAVPSVAHTSDASCTTIRKSVRFDLVAAPVTLQISGSDATSIVFTILPAAD